MSRIITINDVKLRGACEDGVKYFSRRYPNGFNVDDYKKKLWDRIAKTNGIKYIGWFAWVFALPQFPYPKNLRGINLRGAALCGADLRGVDLRGSDLRGASFFGADLQGANLGGTDLRDCPTIWYAKDYNIQGALLPLGRSAWHLKE